jgi:TRAP-type C4-dicarboxylate transport system permease small subunit
LKDGGREPISLPLFCRKVGSGREEESVMKGFLDKVRGLSRFLNVIAGISLTFLMFLTVMDVILRSLRRPIVGTYELVAFSGAVVIGFAVPLTSWVRGHIFVDFFILRFSQRVRNIFNLTTRCLVIVLFFLIGWNMIKYGMDLQRSGEVSLTLQMPFYPVAYGVGVCCFVQCLVMICDILKIVGGEYE